MAMTQRDEPLRLPASLQRQLHGFRRRVWTVKMAEAAGIAVFAVFVAFLCVFGLDRLADTPGWLRCVIFLGALGGCAVVPLYVHHWIWRRRRLEQLARLLCVKRPRLGDELLGIVELVRSENEQTRSRALCVAAIRQVADDAAKHNLDDAAPNSRHCAWGISAALGVAGAILLALLCPPAAGNAWARLLAPWANTPRYTFADIEPLPAEIVVAHGEPCRVTVRLTESTIWRPLEGRIQLGRQEPITAPLQNDRYEFDVPPQIDASRLDVRVGDARQTVRLNPMLRPELTSIVAEAKLPEYLGRPELLKKDVRGGSVSLVKGSRAAFVATASRALSAARVNGRPQTKKKESPSSATIRSPEVLVNGAHKVEFQWEDEFALQGREPFTLKVSACDDEPPSLACEDLPRVKVVLDSEQLLFHVKAQDDFGVKRIGLQWQTAEGAVGMTPIKGEHVVAAGGFTKTAIDARATFSAKSLGIEPQPIQLRVFAEDYFPGRERVYSTAALLYVLDPQQHAIWLTEQLSRWHRQSLEVRDHELRLHETNKQLRGLSPEELDRPETRRRIEQQAAAERANGRRLGSLVASGEDLIRQASRNPEFGVGHLERWAEMLQILKNIAANRMPSVADLLKQASEAKSAAAGKPSQNSPKAGQQRASAAGGGSAKASAQDDKKPPKIPKIADIESTQQPAEKDSAKQEPGKSACKPRLTLPTTTLIGGGPKKGGAKPSEAGEKMAEAVRQQEDLLAEFEKIANELNNVLANLEGSTLVKRLKAAAREQYRVGGRIGDQLETVFGSPDFSSPKPFVESPRPLNQVATPYSAPAPYQAGTPDSSPKTPQKKIFTDLSGVEDQSSHNASLIMDDMQAYYERRRFVRFKAVLEDMKKQDVVGGLRQLSADMAGEPGLSIAQCEYWSDAMDRWAEDLVDAACGGQCPGSKSRASLPPSIILEALHILEGEVNLREETRVAEQAKEALSKNEYGGRARKLSKTQDALKRRTVKLNERIRELPDAEKEFSCEIGLIDAVAEIMGETTEILARPETGPAAIGAETEIIELLLKSRRINPRGGGGGGGSSPGGGGTGTTTDAALALLGIGANEKEVRVNHAAGQSVGGSGRSLPEEFRAGLDEYFHRLEQPDR